MKTLIINSKKRNEFIDITALVEKEVQESGLRQGSCLVYCPHTTAAITINESADPAVCRDIINHLNKIVPVDPGFLHSEGNSDSHIKSSLLGASEEIIIEKGRLALGVWQALYFCEFDGPRSRKIYIKIT